MGVKWAVSPWSDTNVLPEPWCQDLNPLDMITSTELEALVGVPFQIISCDSPGLAVQVRDALNAAQPGEAIQPPGYDVGMCNDTQTVTQTTIPGLPDDPFDGLDVRRIPGDASLLLDLWADDIREAKALRFNKALRAKQAKNVSTALGEQRVVYGIVSVLADDLSSEAATIQMIQARIARVDADVAAAETKPERRVHSVRARALRVLLLELRVALSGGGTAILSA